MRKSNKAIFTMVIIMVAGLYLVSLSGQDGFVDEGSLRYKITQLNNKIEREISKVIPTIIK